MAKIAASDTTWQREIKATETADSLNLIRLLQLVLKTADQNKYKDSFTGTVDSTVLRYRNCYATYQFGNIFSKDRKHLLIKRFINDGFPDLYSDIYLLSNNSFKEAVADTANIGYSNDTLMDINGDNYKDYIVSSYSPAGCCPRDARTAYLYNSKNGKFEGISLFNPEFDFTKHTVYESGYGYPGEISIDKYRWVGLKKVVMESIFLTRDSNYTIVKPHTFTKVSYPDKKEQVLKNVPDEYRKLEIYGRFIDSEFVIIQHH